MLTDQYRSCTRKVKYDTHEEAAIMGKYINDLRHDNMLPYRCRYGHHYHLGHWRKKVRGENHSRHKKAS